MKHLKPFFEAFRTEDYYTEIEEAEASNLMGLDISKEMVDKIMNHIKSYLPKGYKLWNGEYTWGDYMMEAEHNAYDLTISFYDKTRKSNKMSKSKFNKTQKWIIENLGDEWFLVTMTEWDHFNSESSYYWKCDQWEGLERLMDDQFKLQIESMS